MRDPSEYTEPWEARFWAKVSPEPTSGCWLWTAGTNRGYGRVLIDGKNRTAYRVSYELLVGPVPDGLEIDHLCRTHACVNPDHLEAVTHRENVLRGTCPTAKNAAKTECVRGHPLSGENLRVKDDGHRQCLACRRLHDRERWARATAQSTHVATGPPADAKRS